MQCHSTPAYPLHPPTIGDTGPAPSGCRGDNIKAADRVEGIPGSTDGYRGRDTVLGMGEGLGQLGKL